MRIITTKNGDLPGENETTSTVATLFLKMALTGQKIAMVDIAFLAVAAFSYLPQGWVKPEFSLKLALWVVVVVDVSQFPA